MQDFQLPLTSTATQISPAASIQSIIHSLQWDSKPCPVEEDRGTHLPAGKLLEQEHVNLPPNYEIIPDKEDTPSQSSDKEHKYIDTSKFIVMWNSLVTAMNVHCWCRDIVHACEAIAFTSYKCHGHCLAKPHAPKLALHATCNPWLVTCFNLF